MRIYEEREALIVRLDERLEYTNAPETEKAVIAEVEKHPGMPLVLDAENLTYISSAGLRVIMALRKERPDLLVKNVSPEIFEVLDTTGMDEIVRVRKKLRRVSVDRCALIGKGATGTVYRLDEETVVKVYQDGEAALPTIEEDQKTARKAFVVGLPTAIPFDIVQVGDDYGAIFEMLSARSLNDVIKEPGADFTGILTSYAAFIGQLHEKEAAEGQFRSAKEIYLDALENYGTVLPKEIAAKLRELVQALPEDRHLIHGDIQMKNVVLSGEEMMLIDLDHLCTGNPVFEFAALFATYMAFNEADPGDTAEFFGIDADTAAKIFHETLRMYLLKAVAVPSLSQENERAEPDREEQLSLREAELRAATLGYLRFLLILQKEGKHIPTEKKERGLRLAAERLTELACKVEVLAL